MTNNKTLLPAYYEKSHFSILEAISWLASGKIMSSEKLWKFIKVGTFVSSRLNSYRRAYNEDFIPYKLLTPLSSDEMVVVKKRNNKARKELSEKTGLQEQKLTQFIETKIKNYETCIANLNDEFEGFEEAANFLISAAINSKIELFGMRRGATESPLPMGELEKIPVGYLMLKGMGYDKFQDALLPTKSDDYKGILKVGKWVQPKLAHVDLEKIAKEGRKHISSIKHKVNSPNATGNCYQDIKAVWSELKKSSDTRKAAREMFKNKYKSNEIGECVSRIQVEIASQSGKTTAKGRREKTPF